MSRYDQITDLVDQLKPKIILECGTWTGQNAAHMMKVSGAEKYIGFDIWQDGNDELDELEFNVKKRVSQEDAAKALNGVECDLVQGNTRRTMQMYREANPGRYVDFAFIDGGHSVGTITSDLNNVLPMMTSDGVILVDDYYFGNVPENVGAHNALLNFKFPYTVLPVADPVVGGASVKMVRINMRDIPLAEFDVTVTDKVWEFTP